jgi:hypothetical protein
MMFAEIEHSASGQLDADLARLASGLLQLARASVSLILLMSSRAIPRR